MEPWRDPIVPDWWQEKFPDTFCEYHPMKDSVIVQVFFYLDGVKMRHDFEISRLDIESLELKDIQEEIFRKVAVSMLVSIIELDRPVAV